MTEQEKQELRNRIEENYRQAQQAVPHANFRLGGTNITSLDARDEMRKKDAEFINVQRKYFAGQCGDEEIMQMTTQPFWQSMRLSKKRLFNKGIQMDLDMTVLPGNAVRDGIICVESQGNFICGTCVRDVRVRRNYYRNGKPVYSKKMREINHISFLKSKVENGLVACPNCGAYGTVSSYMDGCDFCQSRFTVNDFQAKVSGFSTEENTESKMIKTIGMMSLILAGISLLLLLVGAIGFVLVFFLLAIGQNGTNMMFGGTMAMLMPFDMLPFIFVSTLVLAVLFAILAGVCAKLYKNPIQEEYRVKQVMKRFSTQDFFQNLEYKLRNIHMADSAEAVRAFAECPLAAAVAGYKDVIDCGMVGLRFEEARSNGKEYEIDATAQMKLTEERWGKIGVRYEKLALSFRGRKDVVESGMTVLREYKCQNCGSSMNILDGCTCQFCGATFDYENYGWVITKYQPSMQKVSKFRLLQIGMIATYILVFALHMLIGYFHPSGESWLSLGKEYNDMLREFEEIRGDISLPQDVWEDAVCVESADSTSEWSCEYEMPDTIRRMEEYQQILEGEGFVTLQETECSLLMRKDIELVGEKGYIQFEIFYDDEGCIIDGNVEEYDEEYDE